MTQAKRIEVLGEKKKPVQVSIYPPEIPHGLHCDCTGISEVTGCCLSA